MSYEFLKEDWESSLAPYRDLAGWSLGLAVMNGPGLFWLYIFVEALRDAESQAYWLAPTPTGETSVFVQNVGGISLFVLWTAIVLALFSRPFFETIGEVRS